MRYVRVLASVAVLAIDPVRATCTDVDNDGYYHEEVCGASVDCNDASPGIHPGAPEHCDGYDNDCDGRLDESASCAMSCDIPEAIPREDAVSPNYVDDDHSYPRLAWNPEGAFGIVWLGGGDGNPSAFRTLDGTGRNATAVQRIAGGSLYGAGIIWTGSHYAAVAGNAMQLFDPDGDAVGDQLNFNPPIAESSVAWNGTGIGVIGLGCAGVCFFGVSQHATIEFIAEVFHGEWRYVQLVWNAMAREYGVILESFDNQLFFARLTHAGVPLSEPSAVAAVASYPNLTGGPQLLWTGTEYALLWPGVDRTLKFRRLLSNGTPIDNERILVTNGDNGRMSWNGNEYGLVWTGVQFARVDRQGNRGPAVEVDSNSLYPDIVWKGREFLVSYGSQGGFGPIKTRAIACVCVDSDHDRFTSCVDCNDSEDSIHPGADEVCNLVDDDCDGQTDEDEQGEDADSDAIDNACDNCRFTYNPDQLDTDGDGVGTACDNCPTVWNVDQHDRNHDGRGDACHKKPR